jgi:hypothetical protein
MRMSKLLKKQVTDEVSLKVYVIGPYGPNFLHGILELTRVSEQTTILPF